MNCKTTSRLIALVCGVALTLGILSGCMAQPTGASQEQQANRTYMTKVNQAMEDLNSRLQSFDDAVARGDAVTMRTQADNAYEVIDTLDAIDTPEAMKDLQKDYVDGCTALKEALNAYVDLYTEVDSATEAHPFDYGTYDERIKAIQDKYNEGIQKLKDADDEAIKLNGGDGDESQDEAAQQ